MQGAGTYLFTFVFDGGAAPAKDIVVDNVYAIASTGPARPGPARA